MTSLECTNITKDIIILNLSKYFAEKGICNIIFDYCGIGTLKFMGYECEFDIYKYLQYLSKYIVTVSKEIEFIENNLLSTPALFKNRNSKHYELNRIVAIKKSIESNGIFDIEKANSHSHSLRASVFNKIQKSNDSYYEFYNIFTYKSKYSIKKVIEEFAKVIENEPDNINSVVCSNITREIFFYGLFNN